MLTGIVCEEAVGFGGQYGYATDPTGLIYCVNRYYDPTTARWLSRDPIGLEGGVNEYEYCSGNPIKGADPSGLQDETIARMNAYLGPCPNPTCPLPNRTLAMSPFAGASAGGSSRSGSSRSRGGPSGGIGILRGGIGLAGAGFLGLAISSGFALAANIIGGGGAAGGAVAAGTAAGGGTYPINWGAQQKHIVGANNFKNSLNNGNSKGFFDAPWSTINEMRSMIQAGLGTPSNHIAWPAPGSRLKLDLGRDIGWTWVSKQNRTFQPTSIIEVTIDANGEIHGWPARE